MTSRVMGLKCQGIGFYRPHNNPLMEYFTTNGRLRSNEYMVGKKDVKGLLKSLKNKKLCYYLPDQDYGRNRCEFVPFYAVPDTATTTGTLMFAGSKNCANTAKASFDAAEVTVEEQLTFKLTVTDNEGATASDLVVEINLLA